MSHNRFMKFAASASLLVLFAIATAAPLKVDALLAKAKDHDKKTVTVTGTVQKFEAKTSRKGNKYTTFELKGDKQVINVYMRDHLKNPVKNGDKVSVTGIFRVEKKVGDRTFKNEVDATAAAGTKNGVSKVK